MTKEKGTTTIALAGSMAFMARMAEVRDILATQGAIVTHPHDGADLSPQAIRRYNDEARARIEQADALLVVNERKHDIDGYVGANTLVEIGMAYALHTPIYLLNQYDKMQSNAIELAGLIDGVVSGDLTAWLEDVAK